MGKPIRDPPDAARMGGERVEGARTRVRAAFLHFLLFYYTTCSNHLQPGLSPPEPSLPWAPGWP